MDIARSGATWQSLYLNRTTFEIAAPNFASLAKTHVLRTHTRVETQESFTAIAQVSLLLSIATGYLNKLQCCRYGPRLHLLCQLSQVWEGEKEKITILTNPCSPGIIFFALKLRKQRGINSVVECHLAKVKVASPNLVSRSSKAETGF